MSTCQQLDPGFTGEHARARDIWHFQTTSASAGVAENDGLNFAPDAKERKYKKAPAYRDMMSLFFVYLGREKSKV